MSFTLDYYDKNAQAFTASTVSVDFSQTRARFTEKLEPGSYILDLGCGSGRDARAFADAGFRVDAVDGSIELCRYASEYTGLKVRHMLFQELEDVEKYDGIWACASILHLDRNGLKDVLVRIARALKKGGVFYTSFKYGDFEGQRNGRYFTDLTQESFADLMRETGSLEMIETWETGDVRPGRESERWLNLILTRR